MPESEAVDVVDGQVLLNILAKVKSGDFGARMSVELVNDGPVTIILG